MIRKSGDSADLLPLPLLAPIHWWWQNYGQINIDAPMKLDLRSVLCFLQEEERYAGEIHPRMCKGIRDSSDLSLQNYG